MPVTELRRDSAPLVAEPSNRLVALALKAEAILGYSWLKKGSEVAQDRLRMLSMNLALILSA